MVRVGDRRGLNAMVRVDPSDFSVEPFRRPGASNLNTAVVAPDGAVYFTGQGGIVGRLDPGTGAMILAEAPRGTGPYGITVDPRRRRLFRVACGELSGEDRCRRGCPAGDRIRSSDGGRGRAPGLVGFRGSSGSANGMSVSSAASTPNRRNGPSGHYRALERRRTRSLWTSVTTSG